MVRTHAFRALGLLSVGLVSAITSFSAAPDSTKQAAPDTSKQAAQAIVAPSKATGEYYIIETRHRIFQDFLQVDTVTFGEPFLLGEEEDTARIFTFNPDLVIRLINDTTAEAIQDSDTLKNPAVRIRVSKNKVLQESWAFAAGGAPHFKRNDVFGFKIREFNVTNLKYIKPVQGK
jgi:hypothetical protein